ncbi:CpaF family protein [Natranaerobius thermophilus]
MESAKGSNKSNQPNNQTTSQPKSGKNGRAKANGQVEDKDDFRELKSRLHRALIDEIDKDILQESNSEDEELELKSEIEETVENLLDQEEKPLSSTDRDKIKAEILNETLGFGPITPLIEDENVSEIMVNGHDQVYVEENGKLKLTDIKFRDEQHVIHVIEKIVAPLGRRIDESSPMVDARLPDGSRVNAIIPPLSLTGPVITIRKFSEDPLTAKDLISFGTMTTEISDFLKKCVKNRLNVVVSGGTGSGKTTTLNVLSSFIPQDERIVTIEDAAELTLHQDHVVTLETKPPNMEGKGAITMRELVRNSLRMRPDRIVVGEVRGGEALDMLQAMNTGHDGSLTTGHANSPRDMLSRLETMVLMAGMDLPIRAIREQIASAIDLVVQQSRLEDGSRKITQVSEVQGMEGDVITMQDLFTYKRQGRDSKNKITGKHESTGFTHAFLEKMEMN